MSEIGAHPKKIMPLGEFEAAAKSIDPDLTPDLLFVFWLHYCAAAGRIEFQR